MPLTRRQQEVYDYLRKNQGEFEHPPTLDELCERLDLASRGSLHKHIQALIQTGLVEPLSGKKRGVRLVPQEVEAGEGVPLLGTIAAGRPIEALPQPETIEVPGFLRGDRPCYVLQVRGESMIEEGIVDGDYVIIEKRDHARNGEIVVALVNGEEATLKRIEQQPDKVILHPANAAMAPMSYPLDAITIQGVLIGQMRKYS